MNKINNPTTPREWYTIDPINPHLTVIREPLDRVDPRFHSEWTNLYLIKGSEKALLLDTGCGIFPLKPVIDELIGDRKLLVLNTHSHFDHIGGNAEFDEVMIHPLEMGAIQKPFNAFFLKSAPTKIAKKLKPQKYRIPPAQNTVSIREGDKIDLGGILLTVFHTPGHSEGSVSLLSDKGELFTGDTAHYGSLFLPKPNGMAVFRKSVARLQQLSREIPQLIVYPSHEQYPVTPELFDKMIAGFDNMAGLKETRKIDRNLGSWIYHDQNFHYVVPITPFIRQFFAYVVGILKS